MDSEKNALLKKIVWLFTDVLYLDEKERLRCYDKVICPYECHLIVDNYSSFKLICNYIGGSLSTTIAFIDIDDQSSKITSGSVIVEKEIYDNNKLSLDTQIKIFKLNLDIEYYDKESGVFQSYDRVSAMRAYNINNIIND